MQEKRIILKETTLECLRILKREYRVTSYDTLVFQLIEMSKNGRFVKDISNNEMLLEIIKKVNHNLKRIESIHTRIGFYEKEYFLKIKDVAEEFSEIKLKQQTEIYSRKKNNENLSGNTENYNSENFRKLNLLKSKCIKTDDVFATNYSINLTEDDYKKIFEND